MKPYRKRPLSLLHSSNTNCHDAKYGCSSGNQRKAYHKTSNRNASSAWYSDPGAESGVQVISPFLLHWVDVAVKGFLFKQWQAALRKSIYGSDAEVGSRVLATAPFSVALEETTGAWHLRKPQVHGAWGNHRCTALEETTGARPLRKPQLHVMTTTWDGHPNMWHVLGADFQAGGSVNFKQSGVSSVHLAQEWWAECRWTLRDGERRQQSIGQIDNR